MRRRNSFLSYLIACCAGWIQRQQAEAIDYLKAENRMLRGRLAGRRLIFTDAERRQLAGNPPFFSCVWRIAICRINTVCCLGLP